jgi:alpha-1,2-glucosyltransferase
VNHAPLASEDNSRFFFWLVIAVSLLLGFNTISHLGGPIGDEGVHSFQIRWFAEGKYQIFKYITMLPGYHAANAFIIKILGGTDLNYLRLASMALGFLMIPAFLVLVKHFYPAQAYSRTLQLVFVPIVFPLFFVIYTDLLSLAFALAMIERTLNKKYIWASVFALGAISVRQTNAVWIIYCGLLVLFDEERFEFTLDYVYGYLKRTWPYAIVLLLFIGFVAWNGGVAIGDAEQHQVSFNLSNFYFFLLVSFALFLPHCFAMVSDVRALLLSNRWIFIAIIVMFFVFMATYEHTHKYNSETLSFYRHNLFLHYSSDIVWLKIVSYFAITWMALTYYVTTQKVDKRAPLLLLLPITMLAIVPMPLIEQRYYLVPLCLFIAMRPPVPKVTVITMTYYIVLSSYIMYHISREHFFL